MWMHDKEKEEIGHKEFFGISLKNLLIVVIIVIIASSILYNKIFVFVAPELPEDEILYSCNSDLDCSKVNANCCGCSMGGSQICINRDYVSTWNKNLEIKCRESVICPALYRCGINYTCSCQNSKCITNVGNSV